MSTFTLSFSVDALAERIALGLASDPSFARSGMTIPQFRQVITAAITSTMPAPTPLALSPVAAIAATVPKTRAASTKAPSPDLSKPGEVVIVAKNGLKTVLVLPGGVPSCREIITAAINTKGAVKAATQTRSTAPGALAIDSGYVDIVKGALEVRGITVNVVSEGSPSKSGAAPAILPAISTIHEDQTTTFVSFMNYVAANPKKFPTVGDATNPTAAIQQAWGTWKHNPDFKPDERKFMLKGVEYTANLNTGHGVYTVEAGDSVFAVVFAKGESASPPLMFAVFDVDDGFIMEDDAIAEATSLGFNTVTATTLPTIQASLSAPDVAILKHVFGL